MGKGSNQRPTDMKKFDNNYDNIFGENIMNVSEIAEIPKNVLLTKELFHKIWTVYLYKGMKKVNKEEVKKLISEDILGRRKKDDGDSRDTDETTQPTEKNDNRTNQGSIKT